VTQQPPSGASDERAPAWFLRFVDDDFRPWKALVNSKLQELHDSDQQLLRNEKDIRHKLSHAESMAKKAAGDAQDVSGSHYSFLAEVANVHGKLGEMGAQIDSMSRRGQNRARREKWLTPLIPVLLVLANSMVQRFVLPPGAPNDPKTMIPGQTPTVVAITTVDGGTSLHP